MKILFIGVGLTDYINQLLNKLQVETKNEIYNLIDSLNRGHAGKAVHETTENISFEIVPLPQANLNILSDYRYKGFKNFRETVRNIRPDIIVVTEVYLPFIIEGEKNRPFIKELGIKLIMKDIPFRLEKYQDKKNKIISGKSDDEYIPFFYKPIEVVFEKLKLGGILKTLLKLLRKTKITPTYQRLIGRKVLLNKLENK